MAVEKLEGCDDRALVLEDNHLSALRWGAEQARVPLSELSPGSVMRDDKGKTLGVFGSKEDRVRVDFDRLVLAIWVPLERQADAEAFVGKVNSAVESA
jgi:hypothetical protein